jgi:peptide/nickel transport system ATP-binding protein
VNFAGIDLLWASPKSLREIRGPRVGFVPQNAGTSLTPTQRIGSLFSELIRTHRPEVNSAARDNLILRSLAEVGLEDPGTLLKRYPHQFSGGQQQRIALALALCVSPELIVLDEPTTGQDAITSRGIVRLLSGLHRSRNLTMLFASHDLAILGEICSRIAIMYAGEIVENGPAADVLENPRHPYSQALIASQPTLAASPRSLVKVRAAE